MSIKSSTDRYLHLRLKASLLGVVGSFILFAAYLVIPPIGIFSGILAPFPVLYNRVLHGRTASLIVLIGTTTAITALFGLYAGCLYIGMCGIIGLLLPELLINGIRASRAVFWATSANFLILLAGIFAYGALSGVDIQLMISTEISNSFKQAVGIYEKAGVTGEELELLKHSMATVAEMLKRLYPALVAVMLLVISGCNLVLLKKTTLKTATNLSFGDFSTFKNPEPLVWVLLIFGFSLLLPESLIATPALNVLLIITILYFIQGMAIITALITKHSVPAFVRILLYSILIIQPYLMAFVACIGLFDIWVDFRTPKTQENL